MTNKAVLDEDECIVCTHNKHAKGIIWRLRVNNIMTDKPVEGVRREFVYCSYCDAGKELAKQELLRELLIKK
jgi:hypothetical protein